MNKEEKRDGSKLEQVNQPSTSVAKQSEKITQEKRTSSKEKKLVRSTATCDEPNESVEKCLSEHNEDILRMYLTITLVYYFNFTYVLIFIFIM